MTVAHAWLKSYPPGCRWNAPIETSAVSALLDRGLARSPDGPALEFRPVSRAVNDARFDGPQCLDPPEQASLF